MCFRKVWMKKNGEIQLIAKSFSSDFVFRHTNSELPVQISIFSKPLYWNTQPSSHWMKFRDTKMCSTRWYPQFWVESYGNLLIFRIFIVVVVCVFIHLLFYLKYIHEPIRMSRYYNFQLMTPIYPTQRECRKSKNCF